MAISQKKRQKRLEKKKAKRKSAAAARKGTGDLSRANLMAVARQAPIHECLVRKAICDQGIGDLVISKRLPEGYIAMSAFLVDTYCLGIKNTFFSVTAEKKYRDHIEKLEQNEEMETIHPSCALKLVEKAVDYARDLGFEPHPDYRFTRKIFGDIESDACPRRFEFGKDGKPFYVSGPYETPEEILKIINTLDRTRGKDNFHYLTTIHPDMLGDMDE